ncbi:hypothetical protein Bca4012_094675 [Brassica carinata]|uniref:Uncharacterized protein n=1 Tax=Brassica carinata TaxID=52824 RepID=A0A8X7WHJ2_BRACI|nr:hypothetical protein Bca52824_000816 [Brassica carinata]
MANSYTLLANLRAGQCSNTAEVRLLRERLTEGSVYTLSRFDVTRSNPKFKLTDGPVSIRFNEGTDFEKLVATARTIPTEHFRFRPHEQIIELANTSRQLLEEIRTSGYHYWIHLDGEKTKHGPTLAGKTSKHLSME